MERSTETLNPQLRTADEVLVVDALKALPILMLVVGLPLLAGLLGRAYVGLLWTLLLGVAAVVATAGEGDNYDMPGLGLHLYGAAALISVLALLFGVTIRRAARRNGGSVG
jgi:hypothetical protein